MSNDSKQKEFLCLIVSALVEMTKTNSNPRWFVVWRVPCLSGLTLFLEPILQIALLPGLFPLFH